LLKKVAGDQTNLLRIGTVLLPLRRDTFERYEIKSKTMAVSVRPEVSTGAVSMGKGMRGFQPCEQNTSTANGVNLPKRGEGRRTRSCAKMSPPFPPPPPDPPFHNASASSEPRHRLSYTTSFTYFTKDNL
jgi:hypothetical protein